MSADDFLSRWSRRKQEARKEGATAEAGPARPPAAVVPAQAGTQPPEPTPTPSLPPVESLTPDSDFTPFMKAEVDPALKREALRTLFRDPRFNVMDGLDVYIDDYSKPDPLPEGWLAKMNQMKHLGAYLEEPEKPAEEEAQALQKSIPEQALPGDAEGSSSSTGDDIAVNNSVTESGTAGGKLPRNEA